MRVIVAVTDTKKGLSTLDAAVERAQTAGDDLTVAVYSTHGSVADVESQVRERLTELAFETQIERLEHSPGGLLVSHAETEGYDRIVLPGGDRSPLGKIQFDSTVEFVLLNARTDVTLIR